MTTPTTTATQTPLDLALQLNALKEQRDDYSARILETEQALIEAANFKKPEGQGSFEHAEDRGSVKIVFKQPINATLDQDAIAQAHRSLKHNHPALAAFKSTYKLDTKAARAVKDEDWRAVAHCVTRKPGKVSVEVKSLVLGEVS
ncbi:MAG: hypothetical protein AAF196_06070 [Planctomycetota bacterium]